MHIDTTVDAAIQTADLVVEAVVENMQLKQKLFAEYDDKVVKQQCKFIETDIPPVAFAMVCRPQPRLSWHPTLLPFPSQRLHLLLFAWTGHYLL